MLSIVGFSGSPRRPSKTWTLVETACKVMTEVMAPARHSQFGLSDLGPSLGCSWQLEDLDETARDLIRRMGRADILVVGSPVYKGSYSGLFKHLFDIMPPDVLREKLVLLAGTGGSTRHTLAIEQHMRPLFSFLGTHTIPTTVFADDSDFSDGALCSPEVRHRLKRAAQEALRFFPAARSIPSLSPLSNTKPQGIMA